VEDKAGKDGAERATLGKTFPLFERVGGAVGLEEVATVGIGVEEVKERKGGMESGVRGEDVAGGRAGDGVEHVGDIEKEEGALWRERLGDGVGYKMADLGKGGMNEVVNASLDSDPHLALGKEDGGKFRGEAL
jgi:hypothetical protein